jgi:hypothetical protein
VSESIALSRRSPSTKRPIRTAFATVPIPIVAPSDHEDDDGHDDVRSAERERRPLADPLVEDVPRAEPEVGLKLEDDAEREQGQPDDERDGPDRSTTPDERWVDHARAGRSGDCPTARARSVLAAPNARDRANRGEPDVDDRDEKRHEAERDPLDGPHVCIVGTRTG